MYLITGCAGYIGKRLAYKLLKKGKKVKGLILPGEENEVQYLCKMGLDLYIGNLLEPTTVKGIIKKISIVYHLAGGHFSSIKKMEALYIEGTRFVLEECREHKVKSCIIAGNGAVYGDYGNCILTEETKLKPEHPFGVMTLKMEQLILEYFNAYNVPVIILRIAEVYGPEEYNFLKNISVNNFNLLGDGNNYNSRIHIDDLLNILTIAPSKLTAGEQYNVSDELSIQQKGFYKYLGEKYNITMPTWIPLEDVSDRIKLSIHGLRSLSLRLSPNKIKKSLSYHFNYPSFKEGLEHLQTIF